MSVEPTRFHQADFTNVYKKKQLHQKYEKISFLLDKSEFTFFLKNEFTV